MDSFYDAPRRPPLPQFSREKLSGDPMVPEISLLCPPGIPQNKFTPYSQWKQQQTLSQNNVFMQNKENVSNNVPSNFQNNSILKKVRFESPRFQSQVHESKTDNQCIPKYDTSGRPTSSKMEVPHSFEQMYMANIPSRKLDLSVIDIPKKPSSHTTTHEMEPSVETKSNNIPGTYKEFLEGQAKCTDKPSELVLNDSVTDIFNYKRNVSDSAIISRNLVPETSPVDVLQVNNDQVTDINRAQTTEQRKHYDFPDNRGINNCLSNTRKSHFAPEKKSINDFPTYQIPTNRMHHDFYKPPGTHKESNSKDMLNLPQKSTYTPLPNLNNQFDSLFLSDKIKSDNTNILQEIQNYKYSNNSSFNPEMEQISQSIVPKKHDNLEIHCRCQCCLKLSNENSVEKPHKMKEDDDLSSKDLLKIIAQQSQQIAQQNNQLAILQQQVSELVSIHKNYEKEKERFMVMEPAENQNVANHIIRQPCCQHEYHERISDNGNVQERYVTSTQHNVNEPDFFDLARLNRNQKPNFSIGLTTSFEVSFRRPMNPSTESGPKHTRVLNYEPQPPKIQEITETESTRSDATGNKQLEKNCEKNSSGDTLIDTSLVLKEPIKVRETCPSPEPSIKIEMNDFDDTDSDDDCSQVEATATFYKNLMAQVNKILQKAQIDTVEQMASNSTGPYLNNRTLHKVKQATLKHLQKIGVNLPNDGNTYSESSSSDESAGVSYTQDDVSFAVKQLLIKYLPSDHLAKLASTKRHHDELVPTPKQNIGAIKSRPDFSFATVQYMKKYNLIANNHKEFPEAQRQANSESPKILDISKLKQQPKLL